MYKKNWKIKNKGSKKRNYEERNKKMKIEKGTRRENKIK
jgi:hypothetical protein